MFFVLIHVAYTYTFRQKMGTIPRMGLETPQGGRGKGWGRRFGTGGGGGLRGEEQGNFAVLH